MLKKDKKLKQQMDLYERGNRQIKKELKGENLFPKPKHDIFGMNWKPPKKI